MLVKENTSLKERIYNKTLSSGTKCYIIPKSGYQEKIAIIGVNYGSNDLVYQMPFQDEISEEPEGVAHFVEHKLFEEEWGNVFETFSKSGAQANAFTDCNKTAYYFSCDKDFDKNFEILLNFVQSPYFTKESADREKGIIGQEITMFDDDPGWKVYYNMLQAMYHTHPIKINIAGSVKSIQAIDDTVLHRCYRAFYTPQNMTIVCAGDLDAEDVLNQAQKLMKKNGSKRAQTIYEKEPSTIVQNYVEEEMEITEPMFHIGFKGIPSEKGSDPKKLAGMKVLLDLIAGESSQFYQKIYEADLIDEPFGLQFLQGEGFSFSVISGNSFHSKQIETKLKEWIDFIKTNGISENDFDRIKKKHIGRFIRGFNSVNAICMSQIEYGIKGFDLLDTYDAICALTLKDLKPLMEQEINLDFQVLSVIKAKSKN